MWCRIPSLLGCLPQKNYLGTAWRTHFRRYVCCVTNELLGKGKASLCVSLTGVTTPSIAEREGRVQRGTACSSSPLLTSSPWLLTFSFPLLYCLPLCDFPAFLPLSPRKKRKKPAPRKCKRNKRSWCKVFSSCRAMPEPINPLVRNRVTSSGSGEGVSSRLCASSASTPRGMEAAESVPNEVSHEAFYSELETGPTWPEIPSLGPFLCQQHNAGSLRCRMCANKGG